MSALRAHEVLADLLCLSRRPPQQLHDAVVGGAHERRELEAPVGPFPVLAGDVRRPADAPRVHERPGLVGPLPGGMALASSTVAPSNLYGCLGLRDARHHLVARGVGVLGRLLRADESAL